MSEKGRFISRMLVVWLFAMVFMPLCARSFTVVIDAGHGGKDPGARGARINEKAINLAVALKLGAFIEERSKDVKVVYTRKTDRFVELDEQRPDKAHLLTHAALRRMLNTFLLAD